MKRQRPRADELLEKLDHVGLAGNFSDRFLVIFGHERRGVFAGEFFVFLVKLRVAVGFTERLFEDFDPILGRTRRQGRKARR